MDEQKFEQVLQNVLQPDTAKVKEATAVLRKEFFPNPQSLVVLLKILAAHPDANMRQLAAVQARTLAIQHWESIPSDSKLEIRNGLLKTTLEEKTSLVRHSSARVIAAISAIDYENNELANLPDHLEQAATSDNVAQREVGVYILYALLELMAESISDQVPRFFKLFAKTIKDPESFEVRINTLLALGVIATSIDVDEEKNSVKSFQKIFPSMVEVLKEAVDSGDEKQMTNAFTVFNDCLACENELLDPHFENLVKFTMQLATTEELSDEARTQALMLLRQCLITRRMKIQSMKVGEALTHMAMKIVVELDSDRKDIDDDVTPARAALGLIDGLAQLLPPPHVIVPLLKALPEYINNPDPDYRRAGILSLGFCAEGAPDFLSTQTKEIMPTVLGLLQDPSPAVRLATTQTLARLAEEMIEVLESQLESLLNALIKNLDETQNPASDAKSEELRVDLIAGVCSALDTLVMGMDKEEAVRYLPELTPRLSRLFNHDDEKVQMASIAAFGSLATPCEEAFQPVFEDAMHTLSPFLTKKESSRELDLRAVVSDSMCNMMAAVGPEATKPYVQPMMTASEEALKLDSSGLRESSYLLWSTLAKIYGVDFAHFANGAMSALLESLDQDETPLDQITDDELKEALGTDVTIGKKSKAANILNGDLDDSDSADIEDLIIDSDEWDDFSATSAIAEEKEMALESIGDVMTHVKHATLSFVPKVLERCIELTEHPYEGIKKASLTVLWRVYAMCWQLSVEKGEMADWKPGVPLKVQPSSELRQIAEKIMPPTLTIWTEEEDRDVVTEVNRNLAETLKICGPAMIQDEKTLHEFTAVLLAILQKEHPCQMDAFGDDDGEDDDEMNSEYDWLVIDTALDVVANLAKAFGPSFGQLWKMYQKPMAKHASSTTNFERSTAVGAIAECVQGMGEAVTPFTENLLTVLGHRISDEDFDVRANAAFGVGVLCAATTATELLTKAYPRIWSKLEPLLQTDHARLLDNTAGCVSRMIMRLPESVPLDDALPALVNILPLKEDYDENEAVWPMIVKLYQSSHPVVRSQSPAIVSAIAKVLSPPKEQLSDETRVGVVELVQYLHGKQPALIASEPGLLKLAQA